MKLYEETDRRKVFKVLRNKNYEKLHYSDLLVGDIVEITEGMVILFDGLLIEGYEIKV